MIDKVVSILMRLPATVFGTVIVLGTLAVLAVIGSAEFFVLSHITPR